MNRADQYDAIIVGAGPAGSITAALLAEKGFSVLLVDRAAFPREKACGEYTSPQTESALQRVGALDLIEPITNWLGRMDLVSPSGKRFTLDYGNALPGPKTVFATPRTEFDAALVRHALRKGAHVQERTKVEAVTLRNGRASGVVVREGEGNSRREISGRLIIGADGTNSVVARSLGAVSDVRWPRSLGLVARYKGYNGLDGWGEMHVSARGYAGLAPLRNGLVNVGLVMPQSKARADNGLTSVERFERFAHSFPGVARCLEGAERVSSVRGIGPIGARASRSYGGGFLLVGDAAGFFDPFTGEGVYKAIRGGELAAEVGAGALEVNDLSARRLSVYGRLRRKEFAAKDVVCRMVQGFVGVPAAMNYVSVRLAARQQPLETLTGVLGDYADPGRPLHPLISGQF